MRYATRTRQCSVCGKEMTGELPPTKAVRCIQCSIAATVEHNRQMHEKRGPAWERWKASMAAFAARELAGEQTPPEV